VFIAGLVVAGIAVIRVIVAMSLARGHNWARILISVFAVLNLLGGIGVLFSGQWLTAIVTIVIEVLILWLLWNSSSSAYIKVKTAERASLANPIHLSKGAPCGVPLSHVRRLCPWLATY
jgi:ABC-type multidrug transport system fused ATPase/permease subunit